MKVWVKKRWNFQIFKKNIEEFILLPFQKKLYQQHLLISGLKLNFF